MRANAAVNQGVIDTTPYCYKAGALTKNAQAKNNDYVKAWVLDVFYPTVLEQVREGSEGDAASSTH